MADESERSGRNIDPADPAAMALAVNGASRSQADEYLAKQSRLVDLQVQDLEREDAIRHWSLRVHHISDVLKLTFELALAVILGAIVLLIAITAWSAAHEDGLVIEAFSVPPDMAAQGLTGQAIAAKLQDRLAAIQAQTNTARRAASYSNNWGSDIKVQIPDTGVSIGEFYRMLVVWFGHQSHITGEVYRTKQGLSISVRASGAGGETYTGTESDLDALVEKAAESVYAQTQPYRYGVFLMRAGGRELGARAAFERLTQGDQPPRERAWAYVGLGNIAQYIGDPLGAIGDFGQASALVPGFSLPATNVEVLQGVRGHDEEGLATARATVRMLPDDPDIAEGVERIAQEAAEADVADYLADYSGAIEHDRVAASLPNYSGIAELVREDIVLGLARLHDAPAARAAQNALPPTNNPFEAIERKTLAFYLAYDLGDWRTVMAVGPSLASAYDAVLKGGIFNPPLFTNPPATKLWPHMAWALAQLGDRQGAQRLIEKTPLDCLICLRIRARLAALKGDTAGASTWFARATHFAPSIPSGWSEWGEMLLRKGDLDGAIAKFTIANQASPHFADPLELWGEALIAKNRADLALAKFEEANKYAPHWARLHLKWGEALLWTGDKSAALNQFAIAHSLGLSPAESAALSRLAHG